MTDYDDGNNGKARGSNMGHVATAVHTRTTTSIRCGHLPITSRHDEEFHDLGVP
jgi:hypothetical protein